MLYVMQYYIVIANAFYAKKVDFLTYEEIDAYRKVLYKTIHEEYKYILFSECDDNSIEINHHHFIKHNNGIICFNQLDEEFIETINSIYPDDIQRLIKKSRKEFGIQSKNLLKRRKQLR